MTIYSVTIKKDKQGVKHAIQYSAENRDSAKEIIEAVTSNSGFAEYKEGVLQVGPAKNYKQEVGFGDWIIFTPGSSRSLSNFQVLPHDHIESNYDLVPVTWTGGVPEFSFTELLAQATEGGLQNLKDLLGIPFTADEPVGGTLEDLTVVELKELAESEKIDLGSATKKADIIAVIEAATENQNGGDITENQNGGDAAE